MTYLKRAQDLCAQTETDIFAALDAYYADDVEIIEANGETFHGKAVQRGRILEWQQGLDGFHGAGISAITANEDACITMIESWTDATFKEGGRMRFEEVAVQTWKGDKIVRERFYYFAG